MKLAGIRRRRPGTRARLRVAPVAALVAAVLLAGGLAGRPAALCPSTGTLIDNFNDAINYADRVNGLVRDTGDNLVASGDIYLAGYCWMIRKYDPSGALLWSRTYTCPATRYAWNYAVAVDATGNVVGAGSEYNEVYDTRLVVLKYDKDGNIAWTRTYSDPASDYTEAYGVAADAGGNVIVAGYEYRSDIFEYYNWVVRKYDANGTLLWSRSYNGPASDNDVAYDVAADTAGNIVVVGYENRWDLGESANWVIRRYDANGNLVWHRTYDSPASDWDTASAVAIDPAGNIVVAGSEDRWDLMQAENIVVRKYDTNGILLWHRTYDSPAHMTDTATSVSVDSAGTVTVAGNSNRNDLGQSQNWVVLQYDSGGTLTREESYSSAGAQYDEGGGAVTLSTGVLVGAGGAFTGGSGQNLNWVVLRMEEAISCLTASLTTSAATRLPAGQWITLVLTVTADGANAVSGIVPDLGLTAGAASVEYIAGPSPAGPVVLLPGTSVSFTWTYSISGSQILFFSATATGTDAVTGAPIIVTASATAQKASLLIYGPADSPRYHDIPGTTYTIWAAATWSSKTASAFAQFDAILIGGSGSNDASIWNTAVANRDTWSSAVTGNIVMIGSDPEEHAPMSPGPRAYINQAVLFAADDAKAGPGLYVELHDYMPAVQTTLALMQYFGTFSVQAATCGDMVHKIAQHEVLDSLTDTNLGGWSCTPHAGFHSWPSGFAPLAMDVGASAPKVYTACDGSKGFVFLIASGVTPVCGEPELTKVSSQPGNVANGDPIRYTVSWRNTGIGTMIDLTLTDTLPANLLYTAGSLSFWAQPDGSGSPALRSSAWATSLAGPWTAGQPAGGTSAPLVMRWVVSRVAPQRTGFLSYGTAVSVTCVTFDTSIRNGVCGTVLADSVQYCSNLAVNPLRMGLWLTKTPSGWMVPNGGELTYTIDCENYGPVTAFNAVVWDTLPAGTTFGKCEGGDACSFDGTKVEWTMPPTVPVGFFAQLKLTVTVYTGSNTVGPNSARSRHTDEGGAPLPGAVSNEVTVGVTNPFLAVVKQALPGIVPDGGLVTYTMTVTNGGTDTAVNVGLWDTLPAGCVYYACGGGASCSFDGVMVAFALPDLPPGGREVVTVTASVTGDAGMTTIGPNVAQAAYRGSALLPGPDAFSNPVVVSMIPGALRLEKRSEPPGRLVAGRPLGYVISWTNTGTGRVRAMTLSDALPAGATYSAPSLAFWAEGDYDGAPALLSSAWATAAAGPWTPGEPPDGTPGPLVLRWVVDRVCPARSGWLRFVTAVSSTLPVGASLANGVSATGYFGVGPSSASAVVDILQASLSLVKMPSRPVVPVGDIVTFTLGWSSTGTDTATGVVLLDTLPTGLTYLSCSGGVSCGFDGTRVLWTLGDLAPGATSSVSCTVRVPAIGWFTNTVTGIFANSAGFRQPSAGSVPVTVQGADAVLALDARISRTATGRCAVLDYTIGIRSTGGDTATAITVWDTVPAGTALVGCSGGLSCGQAGPIVTFTLAALGPGQSTTVRFTVSVTGASVATVTAAGSYANRGGAPRPDVFSGPVAVTVGQPQLSVTVWADQAVAAGGAPLVYTVRVRNAGDDVVRAVTVWDSLPPESGFVSASGGGTVSGAVVTWSLSMLAPGASTLFQVTLRPDTACALTGLGFGANAAGADNCLAASPRAAVPPARVTVASAVLTLAKSATPSAVRPGQLLAYRVTWENQCSDTLWSARIWDTLPAGLSYSGCAGGSGCGPSGGLVQWTLAPVPPGASGSATVFALVSVSATGEFLGPNLAMLGGLTSPGPGIVPVSSNPVVVGLLGPRLAVTKEGPQSSPVEGPVEFRITVRNTGTDTAYGAVVRDDVPPPLSFVSAVPPPTVAGASVTWTIGDLPPGGQRVMAVTMAGQKHGPPATIVNRAVATGTNAAMQPIPDAVGEASVSLVSEFLVYPNPFDPEKAVRGTLKFANAPLGSRVRIYTTRGLRVWEGGPSSGFLVEWDGRGEGGVLVAPGLYLWIAEKDKWRKRGTLVVE